MHNDFYASGFLYHPVSQQILLQQSSAQSSTSSWTLFGTLCGEKDDPEIILKDVIASLLGIQTKKILPVYSYANEEKNVRQYIGYAIAKTKKSVAIKNGFQFAWFTFKEIVGLGKSEILFVVPFVRSSRYKAQREKIASRVYRIFFTL